MLELLKKNNGLGLGSSEANGLGRHAKSTGWGCVPHMGMGFVNPFGEGQAKQTYAMGRVNGPQPVDLMCERGQRPLWKKKIQGLGHGSGLKISAPKDVGNEVGPSTIENTSAITLSMLQVAEYVLETQKEPTRWKEVIMGSSDFPLCSIDGTMSDANKIVSTTNFVAADALSIGLPSSEGSTTLKGPKLSCCD